MKEDILLKMKTRNFARTNTHYNEKKDDIKMVQENSMEDIYKNLDMVNRTCYINYDFPITSHRKFIGPILITGKKIVRKLLKWYVKDTGVLQNNFNHYTTNTLNELKVFLEKELEESEKLKGKEEVLEKELVDLISKYQKHSKEIELTSRQYSEIYKEVQELLEGQEEVEIKLQELFEQQQDRLNQEEVIEQNTRDLIEFKEEYKKQIEQLKDDYNLSIVELNQLKLECTQLKETLIQQQQVNKYLQYKVFENKSLKIESVSNDKICRNEEIDKLDYFRFENRFRGPEEAIIEKQKMFLPYFKETKKPILDIGCGRGEFLELLMREGISAKGIDVYEEFVKYCQYKGLDVECKDAIQYLQGLEDNSLGGVFLGQVIEHLNNEYFISLINLIYRKLAAGGKIILESPNPKTLSIYMNSFYMDPTHTRPVHPEYVKYILEENNFKFIEERFESPVENNIPAINEAVENSEYINNMVAKLNDALYGQQDYIIIGTK